MLIENKIADAIEVLSQKKKEDELKLLHTHVKKIDGGKIFKYNQQTHELSPAKYRIGEYITLGEPVTMTLDLEPGHIYIEALNEKNALKRLKRGDWFYKY